MQPRINRYALFEAEAAEAMARKKELEATQKDLNSRMLESKRILIEDYKIDPKKLVAVYEMRFVELSVKNPNEYNTMNGGSFACFLELVSSDDRDAIRKNHAIVSGISKLPIDDETFEILCAIASAKHAPANHFIPY